MQAAGGLGWMLSRCRTTAWVMKVRATACACVWGDKGRQGSGGRVVFRVGGHLAL